MQIKIRNCPINYAEGPPYNYMEDPPIKQAIIAMTDRSSSPTRRLRSDGERNRSRLIAEAKRAFAEQGVSASLEHIARSAEVGIGTLYRHFATRDTLIEAVYREEIDTLINAASRLTSELPPVAALRNWMILFVEFLGAKREIADAMGTLIDGPEVLYRDTPTRLDAPISMLVSRASDAGLLRLNAAPMDLLRAIVGVATVRTGDQWKTSSISMIDLLLRGMSTGGV